MTRLDVILTHFHLDHVCGLNNVPAWPIRPRIWAPGAWLYATSSERLLDPLRRPPISPAEPETIGSLHELEPGQQRIADNDSTGADAARIAADAGVGQLTLIHLNPLLADHRPVLDDARARVPTAALGEDLQVLEPALS